MIPDSRKFFFIVLLGFFFLWSAVAAENLDKLLEPIRKKYQLPALSAAVVDQGTMVAIGTVGYRKSGSKIKAELNDEFHIGSCTKSMTATLAAIIVKQSKISWDTTILDVFPELKKSMDKGYETATLELLLANRGGTPHQLNKNNLWGRIWEKSKTLTPTEQRLFLLKEVIKQKPEAPPGTKNIYSNAGFAIAGAMLERVTGKSWENLMEQHLFLPLDMKTAGFGPPAIPGKINQPWGHVIKNNCPAPIPPGPGADNPPAIGPAGTVHCSMADLAKYVILHLGGGKGKERLLSKASLKKLHTPLKGQNYAFGWIVLEREWGGEVLFHNGCNTMFYAVIWLAPEKDFGVVVACNIAGKKAETGCDQTAGMLIQKFLLKKTR